MKKPSVLLQILSFIFSCILLFFWPFLMMLFCSVDGKLPFHVKILTHLGMGCLYVFIIGYVVTIIQLIRRRNPGIISMIPLFYLLFFYFCFFSYIAFLILRDLFQILFP